MQKLEHKMVDNASALKIRPAPSQKTPRERHAYFGKF
jgi:hypothetical protein